MSKAQLDEKTAKRSTAQQTRAHILAVADRLFYREGVRAVGVDTISAQAGITKRTLYYHFPSKEALITAYLEARDAPTRHALFTFAEAWGPLPGDRILGAFNFLEQWFSTSEYYGCPFVNTVAEHGEIANAVQTISQDHKKAVEHWFITQAELGGAANPQQLGMQIMVMFEGALAYALVQKNATAAVMARSAIAVLLTASGVKVSPLEAGA